MNTSQEFYRHSGITYKGLRLLDVDQTDISKHFPEVSTSTHRTVHTICTLCHQVVAFIDECVSRGGKVRGHSRLQSVISICIQGRVSFLWIQSQRHYIYLLSC